MKRSLALVALSLAFVPVAHAQAPLLTGFGGPLDFGTEFLERGDDSISVAVDVTTAFPSGLSYFGTSYDEVYVNTNGNLSFGASLRAFTPDPFPQSAVPIIAAWWADVDTRGTIDGEPDRNLAYYAVEPGRFVATWIDVGYYDTHVDLLNAFQIVLTAAPDEPEGTFDVELRYNRCEWTTGDATPGHMMGLGGIAAQAGFDAGDRLNYLTLPGSRTGEVLDLCTTSNVSMPGVWRLFPRGSGITAVCGNGLRETGEACDDGNTMPHDGCSELCEADVPCADPVDAAVVQRDAAVVRRDANVMLPDVTIIGTDANGNDATGAFMIDIGVFSLDGGDEEMDASIDMDAAVDAGAEPDAAVPPCIHPDASVPDAGRDAAIARFDAGPREPDAGPEVDELLVTGSGCTCGVANRANGSAILPLAFALLLWRRARANGRRRRMPTAAVTD